MKKGVAWICALVAVFALALLIARDVRAVSRFQIGMDYNAVTNLVKSGYELIPYGKLWMSPPSDSEKQTVAFYWIDVEDERTLLEFNYYKRLIRVRRFKWIGFDPVSIKQLVESALDKLRIGF